MTAMAQPRHHVSRAVAALESTLDDVADTSLWSMDPAETAQTLTHLTQVAARVAELEARVATHAATVEVAARDGATSLTCWWAHQTRQTHTQASRKTRLATGLAQHQPTREALAAGTLLVDQAVVIMTAVEALPDQVDPALADQAERHLVREAAHFDADALRNLGKGLLHVIDPEAGDTHAAKLLEAEERLAAQTTRLTLTDLGDGTTRLRGTLPTAQAQALKKQLLAYAAPKHRAATDGPKEGSLGERLPGPNGWAGHCANGSSATRPTDSHTPAACRRPWWSPSPSRPSSAAWHPASWTPGPASHRARPDASPARPGSSPSSSTATANPSTSDAAAGSTPQPNASPSPNATRPAPPKAATGPPACATPTTTTPGPPAAPPPSTTADSSAPNTTPAPTTPTTR